MKTGSKLKSIRCLAFDDAKASRWYAEKDGKTSIINRVPIGWNPEDGQAGYYVHTFPNIVSVDWINANGFNSSKLAVFTTTAEISRFFRSCGVSAID